MATIDNDEDSAAGGSDRNGQEENLGNGEDDRMLGEELESDGGRTNELDVPEGMEAGATTSVAPASVVAPASMSFRESSPTGAEPGSHNEFAPPGSPQVGNDSRLEETSDIGPTAILNRDWEESSLPPIDLEAPEEAQALSASRRESENAIVLEPDLMQLPLCESLDGTESSVQPQSISDLAFESSSGEPQALPDTTTLRPVDVGARENAVPTLEHETNFVAESCRRTHLPPFLTVETMENFLRHTFDSLPAFALLVDEDVHGIAQSMVSTLDEDNANSISVRDRILRYFNDLNNGGLCPNHLEPLYQWLESLVQPAAPMAGEGGNGKEAQENKGGTGSNSSSVTSIKKERQPYRCPYCGEPKVTYTKQGVKIPHGTCPKHQGTEMGTQIGGSDNDIDRILIDPPKKYPVKYQSKKSISNGQGDPNRNDTSGGGSDNDDDDRKPAAIVRRSALQDSAPTGDSGDPRPPSAGRGPVRPRDDGLALMSSTLTSTSNPTLERQLAASERENSSAVQAPIEGGEASPFRLQAQDGSDEEETSEPKDSGGSGDEPY